MDQYNQNFEEKQTIEKPQKSGNRMLSISILAAAVIIAGSVYFSNSGNQRNNLAVLSKPEIPTEKAAGLENIRPITSADHIRGDIVASVKIVEYSDMECPFCKRFHGTMKQAMAEYGKDGKVAWVYRHFPLDQLHPVKARKEAAAGECANELGGNDAFWKFTDRFFELTPSNNQTDVDTVLPQIAREIGLDKAKFASCLESGQYDKHIQEDIDNAGETGGNGTPWSIVVAKNGKKFPLSGAQPYEAVKQLIELALQEK